MRILAVSADGGGCLHYRLVLPLRELRKAGHRVHVDAGYRSVKPDAGFIVSRSGEIGARIDGQDEYGFELVVFQRWMEDRGADIIRRAQACGQIVVNDVDDWFFGLPTSNKAFASNHVRTNPHHNHDHYRKILAASDAITVTTPYLAKRLEPLGRPVIVLRNYIDFARWSRHPVNDTREPTIGWVGIMDYRSPGDLSQLSGVVGPYLRKHPNARFLHVGSNGRSDRQRMADRLQTDLLKVIPYAACSIDVLPAMVQMFDVAVAPLEGTPFNRAKSYIKGLEASAAGIPFVGSSLPEYETLSAGGRAGIICRRPKDWSQAFERLTEPMERLRLSLSGRMRAAELDIADNWQRWEYAYDDLLKSRSAVSA